MKKLTSGLERQFKECYRNSLRMITTKPLVYRKNWFTFVSHQFRNQTISEAFQKKDYDSIEYHIRRINNQLQLYSQPSVHQIHLPSSIATHVNLGWVAKGGKDAHRTTKSSS
ncbi:hypothetical protein PCANC_14208 [Puccinia coronata f. sp. avenae]|uniref:Uncharacterized protein n=1 Tax=Puccinia coronata f. sp. avenae TaxID=200324 RepID=A0A2N5SYP3_9BASI|nr:hypothetical protein PCANC_14208 [Puccinia coronata f. sp. avenae]PLW48843.1 hypothetical protein PCASD_02812 [Puccinia coronata f. sp. avenae]